MYGHMLRVHGEHLAKGQALPKNTQAVGNGGPQRAGALMGAAEVAAVAATPVTLGDGKSLTLMLEDSDDGVAFAALPVSFRRSAPGGRTWVGGEVLGRLPLPSDCRRHVRVVIGTDDAGASGTVDVVFDYLPR